MEYSDLVAKDVEVVKQERCFDGFFKIDRWTFNHKRFNGMMNYNVVREIFNRQDAVAVLPYDPIRDEVLLIRQLRVAVLNKTASPWIIELIAGIMDQVDEKAETVAVREAKEEAGLTLHELIPIYTYFNSAGGSNERTLLYLALCSLDQAGGYFGLPEENEDIHAFVIKRNQAMQLLYSGEIINASSIIALQWLNVEYKKYMEQK